MSIQVVGMGSMSSVRDAVVQFDDKPVPKELRAACGYVSVLTVVEITTGDTMVTLCIYQEKLREQLRWRCCFRRGGFQGKV